MNIIFKKQTRAFEVLLNRFVNLRGLNANIYFPQTSNSIYNDEDSDYTYLESADVHNKFLFMNLTMTASDSLYELDPFFTENDDRKFITLPSEEYPQGSMVVVKYDEETIMKFKIDKTILAKNKTYKIHYLVPMG